jgi:hypothetical protein
MLVHWCYLSRSNLNLSVQKMSSDRIKPVPTGKSKDSTFVGSVIEVIMKSDDSLVGGRPVCSSCVTTTVLCAVVIQCLI